MRKLMLAASIIIFILSVGAKAEKSGYGDQNYPPAPDFSSTDLMGNDVSLSDFQGKVIFLNFWATWCPPCQAEIPGFVEMFEKYKAKGMQIIGISVDRIKPEKVLEFAKKYKVNYPIIMADSELIQKYEPGRAIPVTIIIDPQGRIRSKHIGYMDKNTLEKYFLELTK